MYVLLLFYLEAEESAYNFYVDVNPNSVFSSQGEVQPPFGDSFASLGSTWLSLIQKRTLYYVLFVNSTMHWWSLELGGGLRSGYF